MYNSPVLNLRDVELDRAKCKELLNFLLERPEIKRLELLNVRVPSSSTSEFVLFLRNAHRTGVVAVSAQWTDSGSHTLFPAYYTSPFGNETLVLGQLMNECIAGRWKLERFALLGRDTSAAELDLFCALFPMTGIRVLDLSSMKSDANKIIGILHGLSQSYAAIKAHGGDTTALLEMIVHPAILFDGTGMYEEIVFLLRSIRRAMDRVGPLHLYIGQDTAIYSTTGRLHMYTLYRRVVYNERRPVVPHALPHAIYEDMCNDKRMCGVEPLLTF